MGIGSKLDNLLKIRNRNVNDLSNSIKVSPHTIYSIIKRDNTKVDLDILQSIADELCVTLDYFSDRNSNSYDISNSEKDLLNAFNSLNQSAKEYLITMAKELSKVQTDLFNNK